MNNVHPSRLVTVIIIAVLVVLPVVALSSFFRNAEATTTVISSNTTLPDMTVNAGDTLIINAGVSVTANSITNNGNIVHRGQIFLNPGETIENNGIFLFAGGFISSSGSGVAKGAINNHPSGIIKEDNNSGLGGEIILNNYGSYITYSGFDVAYGEINNYGTGIIEGHNAGTLYGGSYLKNLGGVINSYGNINIDSSVIYNTGTFYNHATIGMQNSQSLEKIENANGGIFYNLEGANIVIPVRTGGYLKQLFNSGVFNNEGEILNHHQITNTGTFNNEGGIDIVPQGGSFPMAVLDNSGAFNNGNDGSISNKGVVNNQQSGNFDNDGSFVNECGGVFNNQGTFTGNPVVNNCASFPITHMSDTTASAGYGVFSSKPTRAEYVTSTSQLIGDKIDSITLKLKRAGTITGTANIGILDNNNNVKKSFGALNVGTLTTTYTDYEFHLTGGELYTIQSGDRIGIRYVGGSTTTWVAVMIDLDAADPFDGTNSYAQHYQGSWLSNTDRDMYMILKQTHG